VKRTFVAGVATALFVVALVAVALVTRNITIEKQRHDHAEVILSSVAELLEAPGPSATRRAATYLLLSIDYENLAVKRLTAVAFNGLCLAIDRRAELKLEAGAVDVAAVARERLGSARERVMEESMRRSRRVGDTHRCVLEKAAPR
jgi:hypothetical protein